MVGGGCGAENSKKASWKRGFDVGFPSKEKPDGMEDCPT